MATLPGIRTEFEYVLQYLKLVSHDGKEYDYTPNSIEFSFEESVFCPYVHGTMLAIDAVDYPTLLPLLGEERLKASFTRQDETAKENTLLKPIIFDMAVYKMDGRGQESGSRKRQYYYLQYTSDVIFTNMQQRVFRSYKKMPYSEMVKKIYKDFLNTGKPLITEEKPTKGSFTFVCQNMTPIAAIQSIATRAVSETDGFYYVFYEDRDNFYFVPLSYLAKKNPVRTYIYSPLHVSEETPALNAKPKDLDRQLYNIEEFDISKNFDSVDAAMSGEFVSSLLAVDPIRRKFSLKAFDLNGTQSDINIPLVSNSGWDKFPHMEKSKPFVSKSRSFINPLNNLMMVITDSGQAEQEYIKTRDPDVTPYDPEEYLLQTRSHHLQLMKKVIRATVSGDPRIRAGDVIEFKLPELLGKISKADPEQMDKYLQGKYLVVGISHLIMDNQYRMNLELIKDSFFSDIKSRDPVKEYKDII